jgi:hypothetical protein
MDPYGISLQSTDPDLADESDQLSDHGAGDLMDFGASVDQWGIDTAEVLSFEPAPIATSARATSTAAAAKPCKKQIFHPSATRMAGPFTVAVCVLAVVAVIVLFPDGR